MNMIKAFQIYIFANMTYFVDHTTLLYIVNWLEFLSKTQKVEVVSVHNSYKLYIIKYVYE